MYLHKFSAPKIYEYDTLSSEERWNEVSDVILANPPFMSPKGGIRPHKRFSIQANRSEVLFVDYIAEHLNPNGRGAVIVPEGIIFKSETAYKNLRKMLIETSLYAVVSLPAGVFNPYAGVKTSILFLDKNLSKKTAKILFVKLNHDGFGLGAQRRNIKENDLPLTLKIIDRYKQSIIEGKEIEINLHEAKLANVVTKEKIAESGDYNLTGDRYKEVAVYNGKWDFVELSEICDVRDGTHDSPKYYQSGFPLITSKNIIDGKIDFKNVNYISKADLDKINRRSGVGYGDIIMPMIGTIGNPIIVKENREFAIKNVALIKFYKDSKINNYFLKYILESDYFNQQYSNSSKGSTQRFISLGFIRKLRIPLPPLEIQEQIVSELENYQKIIDGAKQVIENYKPTFKIDPEWEKLDFKKVCSLEYGKALPKRARILGKYPVMGSNGISGYHNDYLIKGPAIIVGRKGSAGEVVWEDINCFPIDTTYYIRLNNKKKTNLKYIYYILKEMKLQSIKNGAGIPGLNRNDVYSKYKIPLPSIEIQEEIVNRIENEQKAINANKELITIFENKIKDKIAEVWGEQ